MEGFRWSQSMKVWHIPDTEENRIRFKIPPLSHSLPSEEGMAQIEKFKQWLRSKRYSESTITTYSEALKSFLIFYREKAVVEITNEDVIVYNNEHGLGGGLIVLGVVKEETLLFQNYFIEELHLPAIKVK